MFTLHFLSRWQGECVAQSGASLVGSHFLYSHNLNAWCGGDIVISNLILLTPNGQRNESIKLPRLLPDSFRRPAFSIIRPAFSLSLYLVKYFLQTAFFSWCDFFRFAASENAISWPSSVGYNLINDGPPPHSLPSTKKQHVNCVTPLRNRKVYSSSLKLIIILF